LLVGLNLRSFCVTIGEAAIAVGDGATADLLSITSSISVPGVAAAKDFRPFWARSVTVGTSALPYSDYHVSIEPLRRHGLAPRTSPAVLVPTADRLRRLGVDWQWQVDRHAVNFVGTKIVLADFAVTLPALFAGRKSGIERLPAESLR
jgi:hypothetical protein